MAGHYKNRKTNWEDVTFEDFSVPANFYFIYFLPPADLYKWFVKNKLLVAEYRCEQCNQLCTLNCRQNAYFQCTFRCRREKNFERQVTKFSFLDRTKLDPRDLLVFIRCYLLKFPLTQCAAESGIGYEKSSVQWADFIRRVMVEDVIAQLGSLQFQGSVDIGESRFGTKLKNNSDQDAGKGVWVLWLTEQESKKFIAIPVKDRLHETILPLLLKHVGQGARIYSEGKIADLDLNLFGYKHYTLVRKTPFLQDYVNSATGEKATVRSNIYESVWVRAKRHFQTIYGCQASTFESHICELMWRNWHGGENIHKAFYDCLRKIYTLKGPPQFKVKYPIFLSWAEQAEDGQSLEVSVEVSGETLEVTAEVTVVEVYQYSNATSEETNATSEERDPEAAHALAALANPDISQIKTERTEGTSEEPFPEELSPEETSPEELSPEEQSPEDYSEEHFFDKYSQLVVPSACTESEADGRQIQDRKRKQRDIDTPAVPLELQLKKCKNRMQNGTTFTTLNIR